MTEEAPRIEWKHLLTLQEGISDKQLTQMQSQKVALVVPKKLHSKYPKGASLLNIETFLAKVRATIG